MKTKKLCLLALGSIFMLAGCGETNSSESNAKEESSSVSQSQDEISSSESSSESSNESSSSSSSYDFDYELTTVAEAIEIANQHQTATTERYYIFGTITEISDATYGSMTIEDETGSIYAYGTYSADGVDRYSVLENKPQVGDQVVLYSTLVMYNGTPEIKSGWIVWQSTKEKEFNEDDYAAKTIAEAREMSAGSLVKVSGVVARITYANGMIPSGFYVIDNTSSIYIHSTLAAKVEEGNKITVCGSVDFWILENETTSAGKVGYKGSCQLSDITITANDNSTENTFDKSWIEESTVKNIVDTPATENITNKIFKVNSYVKKVSAPGFVNYYLDDIDGVTGSYVYTQCNGSDFSWLDEFDGKICTVYLTAINAKCTGAGAIWRFMPIEVIDEEYQFDTKDVNEYVWTYHLDGLFRESYTGDPNLEVPTSVSSELLGFENATISYSSSNTDVAYFETTEENTIFHTKDNGKATITIDIDYGTNETLTKTFDVTVAKTSYDDALTVKEAIDAANQEEVIVKGIAGPSLVNQVGFYLIDETGVIAVKTTSEAMAEISLGNEVVFKGTKTIGYGTVEGSEIAGESCILDSTLVTNLYGKHDYSRDTFITDKTLADVYALDYKVDHSTEVYTVKGKISKTETSYYTTIAIVDGDTKLSLYCSSANQYNWLANAFDADTEVTLDIAPCNWNKKKYWAGCVLSATDGTTRVDNTLNYSK